MTRYATVLPCLVAMLLSLACPSRLGAQGSPAGPATSSPAAASAPALPQEPAPPAQAPDNSSTQLKKEEQQRLLGVIPAFNAVMGGHADPLTAGQKFHLFFRGIVDPFQFAIVGVDAGIEQAQGTYPGYHFGAKGYARRYGAAYTDNFTGNLFGNAVLPAILHQDPRYYRLGHGSFKRRLGYTLISTVRCKGDNGHWQFNASNVTGNLIGGGLSNLYYPHADRGAGLTIERGFTVTAEGAIGSFAIEFYPDAIAFLKRHHRRTDSASLAPAQP